MQFLDNYPTTEDMSGAWCNSSAATSSIMEAVSFVTPVLENFFIRTVSEGLDKARNSELDQRCLAFIHEESGHSRAHKRFNQSLTGYLGGLPPGLTLVEKLLDIARNRLSLPKRLLIASALEHFAAVLSKSYLNEQQRLEMHCDFARELFLRHAEEEIAHRSVVFDLWLSKRTSGRFWRIATMMAILLTGFFYLSIAVPWILHHKLGCRLSATLSALTGFVFGSGRDMQAYLPLTELFWFTRRDFHPDRLVDESLPAK
ncbi:MAG: metal-dependent hydrolase [Gallionella sp.]|nr:metal-dependent hydrolase [Gallionella sp.]MDD4946389.1 metal-dependent hydrolase [Gallionella sp.]